MLKTTMTALVLSTLLVVAGTHDAEARHRRLGMHGWCRADAAQMMGISRRAVILEPRAVRMAGGRLALRGLASHGRYGSRAFTCEFDHRGVLQGAV